MNRIYDLIASFVSEEGKEGLWLLFSTNILFKNNIPCLPFHKGEEACIEGVGGGYVCVHTNINIWVFFNPKQSSALHTLPPSREVGRANT